MMNLIERRSSYSAAPIVASVLAIAFHIAFIFVIQGMPINSKGALTPKGALGRHGISDHPHASKSHFSDWKKTATACEALRNEEQDQAFVTVIEDMAIVQTIPDLPDLSLPSDSTAKLDSDLLTEVQNLSTLPKPANKTLDTIRQVAGHEKALSDKVMNDTALVEGVTLPKVHRLNKEGVRSIVGDETFFEEHSSGGSFGGQGGKIVGSGDFLATIAYAPDPKGGYLFKITFVPRPGASFKHISQNVFFLLDRSFSIASRRFNASKAAILHALELLRPGDNFNILVFDDKIRRMAPEVVPFCSQTVQAAKKFLDQQRPGGLSAGTDLYSSLDAIVPKAVCETEVNTAILLSDGDTKLKKAEQRQTVGLWSKMNAGKVSLFSMAAGRGNNLSLLDLLSRNNRGFLSYSSSRRGLDETLYDMMMKIHNPIGKDLVITAVASDEKSVLTLYPRQHRLPDLYENSPYIVYGHADTLDGFYLFVQGKFYDRWFDIEQWIAFDQAELVDSSEFAQSYALQTAYDDYDHFIVDGKESHLQAASNILAPYKIPVAFR